MELNPAVRATTEAVPEANTLSHTDIGPIVAGLDHSKTR